ncbi:AEC family transporter [Sporosarcina sp. USHLN248]|uniref:AEC family transporter n=1 Tax=Sporosarcina sp. USHLN248 TaxID=3081300 RepID=UPI003019DD68
MDLLIVIFPVFFIFAVGYAGQKLIGFDIRTISTAALYLMSPFLSFRTFYTNPLTMDYFYIILFSVILSIVLFFIVWILSFAMKATRSERSAMILGAVFMNSGNYGAPVVLFALGAIGFDYAVIMMVFQSLLMNSFGIFFASIGGQERANWKDALQRVAKMPLIYAAAFGIALNLMHVSIPSLFMDGISLVADASIPTVMLVLGMQLATIVRKKVTYHYVTAVAILRMFISPIVATAILFFMPVNDTLRNVMIIQASMPAAANTTMFALQFGTEPDLVSFTTFITTLLSIVTIPVILFFIGI